MASMIARAIASSRGSRLRHLELPQQVFLQRLAAVVGVLLLALVVAGVQGVSAGPPLCSPQAFVEHSTGWLSRARVGGFVLLGSAVARASKDR